MFNFYDKKKEYVTELQNDLRERTIDVLSKTDTKFVLDARGRAAVLDAEVTVDGQQMTTKDMMKNAFVKAFQVKNETYDAVNITKDEERMNYEELIEQTKVTRAVEDQVDTYTESNRGRIAKRRCHHMEKANKYAKELAHMSQTHQDLVEDCAEYRGRHFMMGDANFSQEEYARMFKRKYAMDMRMCEARYKLDMHIIRFGGNKDEAEKDQERTLKCLNLTRKLAIAKKAIQEANQFPEVLDVTTYEKEVADIERELEKLKGTYSDAFLSSKASVVVHAQSRRQRRQEDAKAAREKKERVEEFKVLYATEIGQVREALLTEVRDQYELAWRRDVLTDKFIAEAFVADADNARILKEMKENGQTLSDDQIGSMKIVCMGALYKLSRNEITATDFYKLDKMNMSRRNVMRQIYPQLRIARKFRNGQYVTNQDRINAAWNRKWILSFINNDMMARKDCIRENVAMLNAHVFTEQKMNDPNLFMEEGFTTLWMSDVNLGLSNLERERTEEGCKVQDSVTVTQQVLRNYETRNRKIAFGEGEERQEIDFGAAVSFYSQIALERARAKYGVEVMKGRILLNKIMPDELCENRGRVATEYMQQTGHNVERQGNA